MKLWTFMALASSLAAPVAFAQSHQPYAGLDARPIKSLSDEQIADLKAGRGMGLALPAELNGYPGPRHLLDLADQLGLSPAQRDALKAMFDAMKAEAIPIGEQLIEQETNLDRLFARRLATAETVEAASAAIGETQARLRTAHLKYHLSTMALLHPEQIERYQQLRGYGGSPPAQHRHH